MIGTGPAKVTRSSLMRLSRRLPDAKRRCPARRAPGWLALIALVFLAAGCALDYFANSRWADAPAHMVGPLLARALEQTGTFRAVVQTPSGVPADLRLTGELIRLQQNFTTRPSKVELTLRVELIDVRGRKMLAARVFDETETAPSDDAYGGVTAANAALQRVLAQIADFCAVESGSR